MKINRFEDLECPAQWNKKINISQDEEGIQRAGKDGL